MSAVVRMRECSGSECSGAYEGVSPAEVTVADEHPQGLSSGCAEQADHAAESEEVM